MLSSIHFVVGMGIVNPPVLKDPSERWHARFQSDGAFYAGNGATAWEAISWALVEYCERSAGINRMARSPSETPFEAIAKIPGDVMAKRFKQAAIETRAEPVRLPIAGVCAPTKRGRRGRRG